MALNTGLHIRLMKPHFWRNCFLFSIVVFFRVSSSKLCLCRLSWRFRCGLIGTLPFNICRNMHCHLTHCRNIHNEFFRDLVGLFSAPPSHPKVLPGWDIVGFELDVSILSHFLGYIDDLLFVGGKNNSITSTGPLFPVEHPELNNREEPMSHL